MREGVAYVDHWVAYQQDRRELPGVVVAIQCDEQLVFSRGYGYADLERQIPMTPQHIFRVASHSKTFTATAIMQLVEQGTLRLDDPLGAHIPWLAPQESLARVTLRQTLNHTGGLIRDGREADYWQLDDAFPDVEGLRRLVAEGGAALDVNETFKYSNIGYALLGLVVEAASGLPYNAERASQCPPAHTSRAKTPRSLRRSAPRGTGAVCSAVLRSAVRPSCTSGPLPWPRHRA